MKNKQILAALLSAFVSAQTAIPVFALTDDETDRLQETDGGQTDFSSPAGPLADGQLSDAMSNEESSLADDSSGQDEKSAAQSQEESFENPDSSLREETARPSEEDFKDTSKSSLQGSSDHPDRQSDSADDSQNQPGSKEDLKELTGKRNPETEEIEAKEKDYQYVLFDAGSSTKKNEIQGGAAAAAKENLPIVYIYHWTDTSQSAEMEAYRFYQMIRDLPAGLPVVYVQSVTPQTGPKYVRDFLDALYGLCLIRPALSLGDDALKQADWSSRNGDYFDWDTLERFDGTLEDLNKKIEKDGFREGIEQLDRLYNPNSGEHFYTSDRRERDYLIPVGWKYEGTAWSISKKGTDVFRLYNPNAGDHHYTLDKNEKDYLVKAGWKDEGIAWKSDPNRTQAVYRAYNPNARTGSHHFSPSKEEIDYLSENGWNAEGISWYGTEPLYRTYSFPDAAYEIEGKAYNTNGVQIDGIVQIGASFYYFDPDSEGRKITSAQGLRTLEDGSVISIGVHGKLATGALKLDQSVYFFDPSSAKMETDSWHLMNPSFDQGKTSLMYFGKDGKGVWQQPSRSIEEQYFVREKGICRLEDKKSNVQVKFSLYIQQHYGNPKYNSFMQEALKYEGWPYVWAGKNPSVGFDCSGLVTWCMKTMWHTNVDPIMTNAEKIYKTLTRPLSKEKAQAGDLVFWTGTYGSRPDYITHVGIYCGNGWMYCAGDPIGFYVLEAPLRPDGTSAPWFFGRAE